MMEAYARAFEKRAEGFLNQLAIPIAIGAPLGGLAGAAFSGGGSVPRIMRAVTKALIQNSTPRQRLIGGLGGAAIGGGLGAYIGTALAASRELERRARQLEGLEPE